jgi:6-phospho-3-hexuloisomerase
MKTKFFKIRGNVKIITSEITGVLKKIDEDDVSILVGSILKAKRIVCCGAGRVGMATRAFSMRLKHLGHDSYFLGDSNVPAVGDGDLLLVSSGSGETQTIFDIVKIAKNKKIEAALITGNPKSRIGKLADVIVQIKAPSKTKPIKNFRSKQPMTSLNEQCLWIFFDALVLRLMEEEGINEENMKAVHSILE